MSGQFNVDAVDAIDALGDNALVSQWHALLKQRHHTNAMFASPDWLAHLVQTSTTPVRLWLVRDADGLLVGLVAARLAKFKLKFEIKSRQLFRKELAAAQILGSLPMLPEQDGILESVVRSIFESWNQCQCLYFDALPTDSDCWKRLQQMGSSKSPFLLHMVDGPRPWHLLKLDKSFEAYLNTLSSKARAALRRKARQAGKTPHGAVKVQCCTSTEDVPGFLAKAVEVSSKSWQHKVLGQRVGRDEAAIRTIQDLAARGILRAYLLELGTTPCAFVIGCQQDGVFHYEELGFREDFSDLSPGTVLLFHIVEHLHETNVPATLNFGVGDASYKRRFGNEERSDVSCLILRRTMGARLLTASHSLFNRSLGLAKKLLGTAEVTK